MDCNITSFEVLAQKVVAQINKSAPFRYTIVISDHNGGHVVNKERSKLRSV